MNKRKTNKSKRNSKLCRNHGQCPHCRGNHTHSTRKRIAAAQAEMETHNGRPQH